MYLQTGTHWSKAIAQNANWIYNFFTGVLASAAYKMTKIGLTKLVFGYLLFIFVYISIKKITCIIKNSPLLYPLPLIETLSFEFLF